MSRNCYVVLLCGVTALWCAASSSADTLRCRSLNGNINCAGSTGTSCQTINGKTVCVSRHGDVVQSFGNGSTSDMPGSETEGANEQGRENDVPALKERLEQLRPNGHSLLLDRNGPEMHLRSDWFSVDRE